MSADYTPEQWAAMTARELWAAEALLAAADGWALDGEQRQWLAAEVVRLRATVDRVRALADEWKCPTGCTCDMKYHGAALRAALGGNRGPARHPRRHPHPNPHRTRHRGAAVNGDHRSHLHIGSMPPVTDEWRAQHQARRESARLRKGEVRAALAGVTDPALRAVLDHHAQDTEYGSNCRGCDQGCSCDCARWPCSTVVLIAELLGVDVTDMAGDDYMVDWAVEL